MAVYNLENILDHYVTTDTEQDITAKKTLHSNLVMACNNNPSRAFAGFGISFEVDGERYGGVYATTQDELRICMMSQPDTHSLALSQGHVPLFREVTDPDNINSNTVGYKILLHSGNIKGYINTTLLQKSDSQQIGGGVFRKPDFVLLNLAYARERRTA